MQIRYINNAGEGFSQTVTVEPETTIGEFWRMKMGDANPKDYVIRVDSGHGQQPAQRSYILQEGDTVVVTAGKIRGA
jgi:hypothetical protein